MKCSVISSVVLIVAVVIGGNVYAQDVATKDPAAGDEPFLKQQWPRSRVLVWAEPGTSGYAWNRARIPGSSVMVWNHGLWTEFDSAADYRAKKNGRPNTQPPDEDTDLILPDAPDGEP